MKRKIIAFMAGAVLCIGAGQASAVTFNMNELNQKGGPVLPDLEDNGGSLAIGSLMNRGYHGEYTWDLGGKYKQGLIYLSTDHLTDNSFSFEVLGSSDRKNWKPGTFATTYHAEGFEPASADGEPVNDDFVSVWQFKNPVRYISVNSHGGMVLSEDDETVTNLAPKAEFDGVGARVPEPASLLLAGLGMAGVVGLRKRGKKED